MKSSDNKALSNTKGIKGHHIITDIIRKRRSIYADKFIKKEIRDDTLEEILTNAIWAPTHKMTEPWRFIIFRGKHLKELGIYMAEYYKDYYDNKLPKKESLEKYNFLLKYPLNAVCVIGIVLVRNLKINLPEWEEIASVSSAIQNMALTCTAHNLGSSWSTPEGAIDFVKKFGLNDNEKSLGLFYIGHYDYINHSLQKKRTALAKKTTWLN